MTIAPGLNEQLDAQRMRALAACPGISMHGSAGVDPRTGARSYPGQPGSVHFGAIFLPDVAPSETTTAWGRYAVVAMADDVIAVEGGRIPSTPVGDDVPSDAERFRALMRLPRMKVWNSGGRADPLAFQAELWSCGKPHSSGEDEPAEGRALLLALADGLIARSAA